MTLSATHPRATNSPRIGAPPWAIEARPVGAESSTSSPHSVWACFGDRPYLPHRITQHRVLLAYVGKPFLQILIIGRTQQHHVLTDLWRGDAYCLSVLHGFSLFLSQLDHRSSA